MTVGTKEDKNSQDREENKKKQTVSFKFAKHLSILLSHMNDLSSPKEAACPMKVHHKIHAQNVTSAPTFYRVE